MCRLTSGLFTDREIGRFFTSEFGSMGEGYHSPLSEQSCGYCLTYHRKQGSRLLGCGMSTMRSSGVYHFCCGQIVDFRVLKHE